MRSVQQHLLALLLAVGALPGVAQAAGPTDAPVDRLGWLTHELDAARAQWAAQDDAPYMVAVALAEVQRGGCAGP